MKNKGHLIILICLVILVQASLALILNRSRSLAFSNQTDRPQVQPLTIVENMGQYQSPARFLIQTGQNRIWLEDNALWVIQAEPGSTDEPSQSPSREIQNKATPPQEGVAIRFTFPGANPHPSLEPFDRQVTHVSYFSGSDPAGWYADVPVWGGLRYHDLYPGVDLVLDGTAASLVGSGLPWRLEAQAGIDLSQVRLQVDGADGLNYDGNSLQLSTAIGEVILPALPATRMGENTLQVSSESAVQASVEVSVDGGFQLGAPFKTSLDKADLITPQGATDLIYSSYLGGDNWDMGYAIAVDGSGSAYATGRTASTNFPATPGAYDLTAQGTDAFVAKFNSDGSDLVYATYLGGSSLDNAYAIAVESGQAYLTGDTLSPDFPTTDGAYDTTCGEDGTCNDSGQGPYPDAFMAKLSADGTLLSYSTYLGGSNTDSGYGIAVASSNVYLTGITYSSDFPGQGYTSNGDGFAVKFDSNGGLVYSTRIGGGDVDAGYSIAVSSGYAYLTGETSSIDFPGGGYSGGQDVFVSKLNTNGSISTSRMYGGLGNDIGYGIGVSSAGNTFVTGRTSSSDFPVTQGIYNGGTSDAFLLKLSSSFTKLYAAYLGGSGADEARALALNTQEGIYLTGSTTSTNFPVTAGAYQTSQGGGFDAFVTYIDLANALPGHIGYSSYLGGSGTDRANGVGIDPFNYTYLTGYTTSANFPTTAGAYDQQLGGSRDVFVTKIAAGSVVPTLHLRKTVTNDNGGTAAATAWTLSAAGPTPLSGVTPVDSGIGFSAGTYILSESGGPAGYTAGTWVCVGGTFTAPNQITVGSGESVTCTINNNDSIPALHLIKTVTNNDGGTAAATAWALTATGTIGEPTNLSGTTPVNSGSNFKADTYTLSESSGLAGYTAGAWSCTGGTFTAPNQIALAVGQSATCTIANNDIAPTLKLIKVVTNNDGGTKAANDWTLYASAAAPNNARNFSNLGGSGAFTPVFGNVGYVLSESIVPGYTAGSWSCNGGSLVGSTVTLGLGEAVTCTITNDDNAPVTTLHLVKTVINDNGGTALATAWTLSAAGPTSFSGTTPVDSGVGFSAGTYTLSESGPAGYTPSVWVCIGGTQNGNQITLTPGQSATCTINNDDNTPALHLRKTVTNDNGGTALATAWTLSAAGPTPLSGTTPVDSGVGFSAGTYTLSESGPAGYTAGTWSCTGGTFTAPNQITLVVGQSASCTINNNDNTAHLTLVKSITNDDGGTALATAWTLGATGPTPLSGAGGANSDVNSGSYILSESSGPAGYTAGAWSCTGGTFTAPNQIALALGQSASCTINNNDNTAHLTLVKSVTNDDGGTALATAWTLSATGPTPLSGAGGANSDVNSGSYILSESSGPAGYTAGAWSCTGGTFTAPNQIALDLGQSASCTINNNDNTAHLTLVKTVTNDDGGTALASAWTLSATGPTPLSGAGEANSDVKAGSYTLSESGGPAGYTAGAWSCTGGTFTAPIQIALDLGQSATCTINNNDNAPTLKLVKTVINNDNGIKVANDWTLSAAASHPKHQRNFSNLGGSGAFMTVFANVGYVLSESVVSGYTAGSWSCDGGMLVGSTVTLEVGTAVTCTITNDDNASVTTLHLVKTMINDNGGTALATAWTLSATGLTSFSGTTPVDSPPVFSAGTYTLSESVGPAGYTPSAWVCIGGTQNGNQIKLDPGQSATCTITNDDNAPTLHLRKIVDNGNGGIAFATAWTLSAAGPTPFSGTTPVDSDPFFDLGSYTLSESGGPTGYLASTWSCVKNAGAPVTGSSIMLALGDEATCTVTNNDIAPTLKLVKSVTNDDGGIKAANDWTLYAAAASPKDGRNFSNLGGSGTFTTVFANAGYMLSESIVPGYTAGSWNCDGGTLVGSTVTLGLDEAVTCTITNTDDVPTLKLVKTVTNNNGGTNDADNWMLYAAAGAQKDGRNFSNLGGSGSIMTVFANSGYVLSESAVPGYTTGSWSCNGGTLDGSTVTLRLGEAVTCTITNDDIAPKLHLRKLVTNDNGGTATVADFPLLADGILAGNDLSGISPVDSGGTLKADIWTLSETPYAGYSKGDWVCVGGTYHKTAGGVETIQLGIDQEATCTITNNDNVPVLLLRKTVTNDNDGTALATAWTLIAAGPTPLSGSTPVDSGAGFSAGTYKLSESGPSGYTASDWSCVKNGGAPVNGDSITLGPGDVATCTINNDDNASGYYDIFLPVVIK